MPKHSLPTPPSHFGTKPESLAIQAICRGIVAGMLADHFLGRSEASFEPALRPSILASAQHRRFGVFLEFPLKKVVPSKGSYKKLDVVLIYGRQVLAVEIKTIRRNAHGFSLTEDLRKLIQFADNPTDDGHRRRISSWQLVAWDSETFARNGNGRSDPLAKGLNLIAKALKSAKLPTVKLNKKALQCPVSRTAQNGSVILVDGYVGNRSVWCAAVCVRSPSK